MKTRTGFVSNSSSSSFVAVATTKAFEEAVSRLKDNREKKIINHLARKGKCLGHPVRILSEAIDAGGSSQLFGYEYRDVSVDNYTSIIEAMKKETAWKDQVFFDEIVNG